MQIEAQSERENERWEADERIRLNKEDKKRRVRESRLYVYDETKKINRLKKRYKGFLYIYIFRFYKEPLH